MADQPSSTPTSSIDPYKTLNMVQNPDGSVTRQLPFPTAPTTPTPPDSISTTTAHSNSPQLALSKDIPINPKTQTFIRLFKPHPLPEKPNLPLIIYLHGGGFVIFSAASQPFHDDCCSWALTARAVVASIEYRLAPDHPLPAAYDDTAEAITWLRNQASDVSGCDPWLKDTVDFSKSYIMGGSAGANIVYHVGLRFADVDLSPIRIQGLVMNQPFFGGVERTKSEMRLINDRILPLVSTDSMWAMSLPKGADRDHEYCNPMAKGGDEKIGRLPTCVVRGFEGDPLVDRQKEFVAFLEKSGVRVVTRFDEGGCHGGEFFDPSTAQPLYDIVNQLIRE